jgi:hypothetical protein
LLHIKLYHIDYVVLDSTSNSFSIEEGLKPNAFVLLLSRDRSWALGAATGISQRKYGVSLALC